MFIYERTNNWNISRYYKSKAQNHQVVNAGQLSVIKPNVAHLYGFTKDTTFLNLMRQRCENCKFSYYKTFCGWEKRFIIEIINLIADHAGIKI